MLLITKSVPRENSTLAPTIIGLKIFQNVLRFLVLYSKSLKWASNRYSSHRFWHSWFKPMIRWKRLLQATVFVCIDLYCYLVLLFLSSSNLFWAVVFPRTRNSPGEHFNKHWHVFYATCQSEQKCCSPFFATHTTSPLRQSKFSGWMTRKQVCRFLCETSTEMNMKWQDVFFKGIGTTEQGV